MSWVLSLNGVAVLVVDDHADSQALAAEILGFAGARVSTASSGHEALERLSLEGDAWDVVVTDISMPNGTGYDLIREARRRGSRVPMIALTALDTPEHRGLILSSGFACRLAKPFLPERLIAAVWEVANPTDAPAGPPLDEASRWNPGRAKFRSSGPRESTS